MSLYEMLNDGQRAAVDCFKERFENKEKVSVLSAGAGFGKSFMINATIETLGLKMDEVLFATFTGKAADVLVRKGVPCQTIHRSFYNTKVWMEVDEDGVKEKRSSSRLKTPDELKEFKLIVIDEFSMCPGDLFEKILTFGIPIFAVGDDKQLPAIGDKSECAKMLESPDATLTEPMRQAGDSQIIAIGAKLRNNEKVAPGIYGDDVRVLQASTVVLEHALWADQVIVSSNKLRADWNEAIRAHKGFSGPLPQIGERVISLKNMWSKVSSTERPLINGTIGIVKEIADHPKKDYLYQMVIEDEGDGGIFTVIGRKSIFDATIVEPKSYNERDAEFDFAYAITVWKAQGSEWDRVFALIGGKAYYQTSEDYSKLQYTALTRASKRCILAI